MLGSSGTVPVTGGTHGGSSIVVNTPPGVTGLSSTTFATINKRMQSQGPASGTTLVQVQTVSTQPSDLFSVLVSYLAGAYVSF